ncbi:MAG: class I SAM-dependent methyltransferase [Caldilineaceae bacterium]|nr:class I SAM-dependent methyltransferase [Caldilineaceae bacterium]
MTSDLNRTAEHWAKPQNAQLGLYWTDLTSVQSRLNHKVSGNDCQDWLNYTLHRYFTGKLPLARCYSLGCGHGEVERQLARSEAFILCEASDISDGAIAEAQRAAIAEGLTNIIYTVKNANALTLQPQTYDAVWAHASIHHFECLDHVFATVATALKPNGLFILNEYIGPSRFQFPLAQRQAIQACLDLLPAAYRQMAPDVVNSKTSGWSDILPSRLPQRLLNKWRDGDLLTAIGRRLRFLFAANSGTGLEKSCAFLPTERSVISVDPSEAVHSAEIVPVLKDYFEIVEYKSLGGTILQFLLADIAGNFEQNEASESLLQMLYTIEDTLIETGYLDSDFAYIVATPKRGKLAG